MNINTKISKIANINIVLVYGFAQILNILSILAISKYYNSEQYGIYVLVSSLAGIIITLSNGKYHNNIVSSNILADKQQLAWLSLIISSSTTLVFYLTLIVLPFIFHKLDYLNEHIFTRSVSFWIAIYCLLAGLNILTDSILNAGRGYLKMSFGRLLKAIFFLIGILILKTLGWKGLILSIIMGQFVQLLFNSNVLLKFVIGTKPLKIELKYLGKKYIDSPKYNIPLSMLISSSDYILYSLVRYFWGLSFLGSFSLAEKIIKIPVSLVGQPLAEQFFKKSADLFDSKSFDKLIINCFEYLKMGFLIMIFPFFGYLFFSESLVKIFMPGHWHDLGWMLSILSPVIFFYFILASWRSLSVVLRIQKQHFIVEVFAFILLCASIILAGFMNASEVHIVVIKMLVEILVSIFLIFWLFQKVKNLTKKQ